MHQSTGCWKLSIPCITCALIWLVMAGPTTTRAADHGDTPLLIAVHRHDARLTDLFAFVRGSNLVLAVGLDPTIPPDVTDYVFAADLKVTINIDNDTAVSFEDSDDLETFGGTIDDPKKIREDVVFKIQSDDDGRLSLKTFGLRASAQREIRWFAGLRDDPFIRGPRLGRNVAAIVIEIPLEHVVHHQDTILVWATSKVEDLPSPFQEFAGRALRSQFPENDGFNSVHPRNHFKKLGQTPDVLILDTSARVAFPNGRELTDDVVDLVDDPRVLGNDAPFPAENDVPFMNEFPYLAPPHPPN